MMQTKPEIPVTERRRSATAHVVEEQHPGQTAEETQSLLYGMLPSVHELLLQLAAQHPEHPREQIVSSARAVLRGLRAEVGEGRYTVASLAREVAYVPGRVAEALQATMQASLKPVINATGVLLHTNLGRAPLSENAIAHLTAVARGYSNLELDLATGQRGKRDEHVESLLLRLLAEATGQSFEAVSVTHKVAIVNNCAAATFLTLNALADGREVTVSRGELVEIGGGFRIPDILRKSGALLREVGTTNRTRIADYREGVNANTALLLRVHQSNFSMEGFTERCTLGELVQLGRERGIPVFEDQGTGLLLSPAELNISCEGSLVQSFRAGVDILTASGDKLLGGPQCGVIIGRSVLIEKIRSNPLLRTYRPDKLTYAALEATLLEYLAHRESNIPLIRMMRISAGELEARCHQIIATLDRSDWESEVVASRSVIGGGTTPGATLDSFSIRLRHKSISASVLLAALRRQTPPLIGRIHLDDVVLDLRAVLPGDDDVMVKLLHRAAEGLRE